MKNPLNWLGWLGLMFLLAGATGLSGADVSEAAGNATESALLPGHAESHEEVMTHDETMHIPSRRGRPRSERIVGDSVCRHAVIHRLGAHFGVHIFGMRITAKWRPGGLSFSRFHFWRPYKGDAFYEILHIVLLDYVPFIILLGALFTAAGGICLKGSLRGSPWVNTAILFIGTVLASWMGTTGAAMLLIRPICGPMPGASIRYTWSCSLFFWWPI